MTPFGDTVQGQVEDYEDKGLATLLKMQQQNPKLLAGIAVDNLVADVESGNAQKVLQSGMGMAGQPSVLDRQATALADGTLLNAASRVGPGIQQRGNQIAQQQRYPGQQPGVGGQPGMGGQPGLTGRQPAQNQRRAAQPGMRMNMQARNPAIGSTAPTGMPALRSNLPRAAAQGGIIGYEEGGDVDGGWWEILKEADRKRTAQRHEEQQLRREQGRSIRDYVPFMEPKGQLWIENALYDASRGIGSLLNKRRPEAGATGSAVLSETDTFRRATEILNNPESTDEQKAFARMQLEGLQDAPMRAEMLQQVDKINAARGAGMAGGGPIKRYQSVGSVESGRGDTPPGRIPVIAALERWGGRNIDRSQKLRELTKQIQYEKGVGFTEAQAEATAILDMEEGGAGIAGGQLGGEGITGGQTPIERPPWYEQLPVDRTAPEVGTQVRGPTPEGGAGQEQLPPGVPPQDALFPQEPRRAVASSGLAALPYEQAEFNPREQQLYDQVMGQAARDPVQEGIAAGQRVRDLMGADDLMARRAEEFEGLQSLREAQFDPKESLLRRWKAGLAQGAKQGLGGFGAGVGSEEDKILAEQLGVRESSVENMDKLIADLRALGLSQYKAEQEAQKMVGDFRSRGLTDTQALLAGLRATNNALIQGRTQRDVATITGEWQEAIARLRNANNTDLMDKLEISARGLRREDPNLSYQEAMEQAYEIYKDDQLRLGFARIGVTQEAAADQRNIDILLAAVESVDGMPSFTRIQLGIMNADGSMNDDKRWDAIERAAERLGGILETMEGTTPTTTQAMDRISEIVGRTITDVQELTPEEHIQLRDAGLLQGN